MEQRERERWRERLWMLVFLIVFTTPSIIISIDYIKQKYFEEKIEHIINPKLLKEPFTANDSLYIK